MFLNTLFCYIILIFAKSSRNVTARISVTNLMKTGGELASSVMHGSVNILHTSSTFPVNDILVEISLWSFGVLCKLFDVKLFKL